MDTRAESETGLLIRREEASDHAAIRELVVEVFQRTFGSGEAEATLVEQIRLEPGSGPALSLVALSGGVVIGHALFSAVRFANHPEVPACALGPLGVSYRFQRRGVGTQLVERGVRICRELGYKAMFVQGSLDYYPRFGFIPLRGSSLHTTLDSDHDMVLALEEGILEDLTGLVEFPAAWHAFI